MDINVKGVWFGCKYAILAMRESGGGSVINTASFVALMGAATPQLACKLLDHHSCQARLSHALFFFHKTRHPKVRFLP